MTNSDKAKEMAKAGVVPEVKLVLGRRTDTFLSKCRELDNLNAEAKAIEARKREINLELQEYFTDSEHKTMLDQDLGRITLVSMKRGSINKKLLIENGVTVATIEKSTTYSESQFVKITKPGQKDDNE